MSARPDLDADQAVRALGARLNDWGVQQAGHKARAFIDDLTARGWRCRPEATVRRNPGPNDRECPKHPGEHEHQCRCCAADHRAEREAAVNDRENASKLTREESLAAARAAVKDARDERAHHPTAHPTRDARAAEAGTGTGAGA